MGAKGVVVLCHVVFLGVWFVLFGFLAGGGLFEGIQEAEGGDDLVG